MKLAVELTSAEASHDVTGTVHVIEGGKARSLRVTLDFREETADVKEIGRTVEGPVLHEGDLQTGQEFSFSLRAPDDALPGYEGRRGSLFWAVAARVDRRGLDVNEYTPVELTPPS